MNTTHSSNLNAERRKQKAMQRLGSDHPTCVLCGEDNPHCLELHHLGQTAFDDQTVPLCRNCHRKASDAQQDHLEALGAPSESELPGFLETVGHWLMGLADFFQLLVDKLRAFGQGLIEWAGKIVAAPEAYDASVHGE
jgi:hypothetical protein